MRRLARGAQGGRLVHVRAAYHGPSANDSERATSDNTAVDPRRLLDGLLGVARALGVEARVEPFEKRGRTAGGLCRVRGRQVILVDANSPLPDQVGVLAEALGRLDLSSLTLPPELGLLIDDARERREWEARGRRTRRQAARRAGLRELGRPKPGLRSTRRG